MKLYSFPGSCALAGHIVLVRIGKPYETVRMSTADVKTPKYLAVNPEGAIPLLVEGDVTLTQNAAILSYLADRYPDAEFAVRAAITAEEDESTHLNFRARA